MGRNSQVMNLVEQSKSSLSLSSSHALSFLLYSLYEKTELEHRYNMAFRKWQRVTWLSDTLSHRSSDRFYEVANSLKDVGKSILSKIEISSKGLSKLLS